MTDSKEMTNSELLAYKGPSQLLGGLERQRQFILKVEGSPRPCPNCAAPLARWDALGLSVDEYDLINGEHPDIGECPNCRRKISFTLPWPVGGWFWRLEPVEAV